MNIFWISDCMCSHELKSKSSVSYGIHKHGIISQTLEDTDLQVFESYFTKSAYRSNNNNRLSKTYNTVIWILFEYLNLHIYAQIYNLFETMSIHNVTKYLHVTHNLRDHTLIWMLCWICVSIIPTSYMYLTNFNFLFLSLGLLSLATKLHTMFTLRKRIICVWILRRKTSIGKIFKNDVALIFLFCIFMSNNKQRSSLDQDKIREITVLSIIYRYGIFRLKLCMSIYIIVDTHTTQLQVNNVNISVVMFIVKHLIWELVQHHNNFDVYWDEVLEKKNTLNKLTGTNDTVVIITVMIR